MIVRNRCSHQLMPPAVTGGLRQPLLSPAIRMGNRKEPIETEWSGIPNHHALHNRQSSTLQLLRRLAVRRLALRWRRIHADRITVEERVYEGEFDDVKTDAGEREVPFDKRGLTKSALIGRWNASKHRQPDDLVFCTRKGGLWRGVIFYAISKSPQPNWDSRRP